MEVIGETTYNDKDGIAVLVERGETVLFLSTTGNTWMVAPPSETGVSPQEQVMHILSEKLLDGDFIKTFLKVYGTAEQQPVLN